MEGSTRRFEEGEDGQCINGARGDHEWHQVSHASRRDVQEEGGTVEGDEAPTRWATRRGRAAAVAASAAALCAVCLLVAPLYFEGRAPEGPMELSGVGMMRKLYQEDPGLVEAWAASSGKKQGAMMLAAVTGQGQKSVRHFQNLDKDMEALSGSIKNVEWNLNKKIERPMLPAIVNRNAAWMVVQDLSSHWDSNANYTQTPWEFCAGRHLSRRQLRDCAEHLIQAAGVKYHRDLNLDTKIYQLMCTDTGHTYIDNRGSTYALPVGTKAACDKIVSARNNVDMMMKRQVTMYKSHVDDDGHVTPPKAEKDGSHGVSCGELEMGCR